MIGSIGGGSSSTYVLFNMCFLLSVTLLLLSPSMVSSVHGGDVEEVRYGFRPHYRKLPRLPLPLLTDQAYAKRFDREDRDYKPLMFGKRAPDYMPPMFGKRGADYMPPVFG